MAAVDTLNRVKIKAMLIGDRRVGALDIGVEVHEGTAVLRGEVDSEEQKEIAEQLAWEVEGITEVENELRVAPAEKKKLEDLSADEDGIVIPGPASIGPGAGSPSGLDAYSGGAIPPHWWLPTEEAGLTIAALTEAIERRIAEDGRITSKNIKVAVDDGTAHLTGTVDSLEEYYLAQEAAESVAGIKDVKNDLEIEDRHTGHDCNCGKT